MKKFSVFLCATILLFGFAGMANASLINLISNGSFESPEVTMSPAGYTPNEHWGLFESIDSWTHSGDWVELQEYGLFDGFAAVNDGGDQWVELDAYEPYTLSQGFAAEIDKMYTVSFAYSARPNVPNGAEMGDLQFSVVGEHTETIDVNTVGWQYYDYTFQATQNEYSITFTETGGTAGYGIFLDAVSVVDPPPVPEPATMLLLGTGLIGFAALGRKRFLKK